jgi:hypothetical protein
MTNLFFLSASPGLKIAIVGSGHLTRRELIERDYDTRIHDLLASQNEGITRFLLGRQLIVVPLGFLMATITLFEGYGNLPSGWYFLLVGLGLPGMIVTMQVAQLAPQVFWRTHKLSSIQYTSRSFVCPFFANTHYTLL